MSRTEADKLLAYELYYGERDVKVFCDRNSVALVSIEIEKDGTFYTTDDGEKEIRGEMFRDFILPGKGMRIKKLMGGKGITVCNGSKMPMLVMNQSGYPGDTNFKLEPGKFFDMDDTYKAKTVFIEEYPE